MSCTEITMTTNDINNFSVSELNYIRETIENMNKFHQVEILRLLHNRKTVMLNENKYGIHINLSELDKETVDILKYYIDYVKKQENTLNEYEKQKEIFKNIYFSKDNKDNTK
jgi:hypothetical protein